MLNAVVNLVLIESMEPRRLMSGTPVLSTAVTVDQLEIKSALLQFRSDIAGKTATLLKDASALQAADLKQDSTLEPLFATLHKEVKSMNYELKSDRLAEESAVLGDESIVVADRLKIRDERSDAAAQSAAKHALVAELVVVQDDEIAGLNSRIATRKTYYTDIFNDISAITTILGSDSSASAALINAVNQFTTDRTSTLNTLVHDLHTIVTDRTQLASDLMAMESAV